MSHLWLWFTSGDENENEKGETSEWKHIIINHTYKCLLYSTSAIRSNASQYVRNNVGFLFLFFIFKK